MYRDHYMSSRVYGQKKFSILNKNKLQQGNKCQVKKQVCMCEFQYQQHFM